MADRERKRFSSRISLVERVASMRRDAAESQPAPARSDQVPSDQGDPRLERLEARVEHLEAALEGLQDAVHRDAIRHDEDITELQRRTRPGAIAQALSADARDRGL